MSGDDDKKKSLDQLSQQRKACVISQLVDIGAKRNQKPHSKFCAFVTKLQCLKLGGTPEAITLRRTTIDASENQQYIALSYTWGCSTYEDRDDGSYHVQDWDSPSTSRPSSVRNCVLDRALHYMHHYNVKLLWIDAHCIRQDACPAGPGGPCSPYHPICAQKQDALQAMDLVYQLSKHPIALLGRPINKASELCLLHRVLSRDLVYGGGSNGSPPRLSQTVSISYVSMALSLLHEITQDNWWTRAWTFQENYRGGVEMRLLIRHSSSLEGLKLQLNAKKGNNVLGDMPGELRVKSVTFFEQATLLCQVLRGVVGYLAVANRMRQIEDVERAAGRYQLLLSKSSSMTPRVLADVESRELSQPWDRLAIVANCCRYPIRLDKETLSQQGHSLSLSLLAMCLVNGEILDNGDDNDAAVSVGRLTASGSLEKLMFKKFQAPENEHRHLTFNKGCRLTGVELTASGVATLGHLWELGPTINTANLPWKLPSIDDPNGVLGPEDRNLLQQLVFHLRDSGHYELANHLNEYLKRDSRAGDGTPTFTEEHFLTMAEELAAAIHARRNLVLGRIWCPGRTRRDYSAIFIMPDRSQNLDVQEESRLQPSFVFTSVWPGDECSHEIDANDTDCYASLGVDIEGPRGKDGTPRLRIRSWLLGMCFFAGYQRVKVVFPWPKALQGDGTGYATTL
ncbi:hypothetical protein RB595_008602 [Gaeumannomyces hyphopodioides]